MNKDDKMRGLLAKIEKVGTKEQKDKALDLMRKKGMMPEFSTEETSARGKELMRDVRQPEKMVTRVPGSPTPDYSREVQKIKSGSEAIEETGQKLAEHRAKREALRQLSGKAPGASKALTGVLSKLGKRGLKSIPFLGAVANAVMSDDASAAIPLLGEAEDVGPTKGSIDSIIEDPSASPEQRKTALEEYRRKRKGI
jgi:hypothetical protein